MYKSYLIKILDELEEEQNDLSFSIRTNKNNTYSLWVTAKSTPYRVGFDSSAMVLRYVLYKTKENVIEVSSSFKDIVSYFALECEQNKEYIRFTESAFLALPVEKQKEMIYKIAENSFTFSTFGCCSRFPECEKTGCTHPDKLYATSACTVYKRLFEK